MTVRIPLDVLDRLIDMATAYQAERAHYADVPHTPRGRQWADNDVALNQAMAIHRAAREEQKNTKHNGTLDRLVGKESIPA